MFHIAFNCKFIHESSSEKSFKSVKIWQKYGHESVARFLAHPVYIKEHYPLQGVAASYPFSTNSLRRRRRCESIVHCIISRDNVDALEKFRHNVTAQC